MNLKHFCWKKRAEAQSQAMQPEVKVIVPNYNQAIDSLILGYVNLTKKHHSVLDVCNLYEKLISDVYISFNQSEEIITFVSKSTARLFEMLISNEQYSIVMDTEEMTFIKIEQEIIASLYLFSMEHEINFAKLFDSLYEETRKNQTNLWSFDAFATLPIIAKEHAYIEFEGVIAHIWKKYCYDFLEIASEESLHMLSDNEYADWEKMLQESLNDEDNYLDFQNYSLDVFTVAIPMAFPALISEAYTAALYVSLADWVHGSEMMNHFCEGILPAELLDEDTPMALYLLRRMADYTKYQSIEFPIVRNLWEGIIDETIFYFYYGNDLNEVVELLIYIFGIPKDEVEDYIYKHTYQIIGDMQHDSTDAYFLAKMLCNKYAFDVVDEYNSHFINSFAL